MLTKPEVPTGEKLVVKEEPNGKYTNYDSADGACRCNYLAFSEPQFEADIVRKRMCNGMTKPMKYIGFTRSVLMHFEFERASSIDSFNVTFESESMMSLFGYICQDN